MSILRSLTQKIKESRSLFLQLLFVTLAFALMVISSYFFVNNMLRNYLRNDAEGILVKTQSKIIDEFREAQTLMMVVSDDIYKILMQGGTSAEVRNYIDNVSNIMNNKIGGFTFGGIHGFFDRLNNLYIPAEAAWIPPEGYDPQKTLWYTSAVEANGEIAASPIYISPRTGKHQFSYVRRIFDQSGNPMGVIALHVPLQQIMDLVVHTRLTESGFGFLSDTNYYMIAHPDPKYIGTPKSEISAGSALVVNAMKKDGALVKIESMNSLGVYSIHYCMRIDNGWHLGVVVPRDEYYKDLSALFLFLSVLGLILIAISYTVLIRIDKAKKKSDKAFQEQSIQVQVIEKTRESAETANRAKSVFLANMSHEIRTPMNSIIGFSELAQDDNNPPKTEEYLKNIEESAKWLLQIINDILDISKIEAGKMKLDHVPFELHDVFIHCQSVISQRAAEKGVTLYCYAEPSIGKKLLGDPVRLRQVLINILSNAVKFTNIGTVKLLASLKEHNESSVIMHFEIKDSGIGMKDEQIERIFEPFNQADESVSRKYGGTGLGLAITKNFLEMMGTKLEVASTPGIGSIFSFDIKFDTVSAPVLEMDNKEVYELIEQPAFRGEVLICEDNYMNQQVICDHLNKIGLKTVVANDGHEAVNIVSQRMRNGGNPFDLIFMDIHMPVMDGLEATAQLIAQGVKTPIVALTANIMVNDLELYTQSGMSGYLGKPFTSQELWKCLMKYLSVTSVSAVDEKAQAMDKSALLKRLQIMFVKNNQKTFSDIKKAIWNENIKLAHRLAHILKSNAGQIGETALQAAAAAVEGMLLNDKNLLTEKHSAILEDELKSVLDKLAPLLSEAQASIKNRTLSKDEIHDLFERLEIMLKNRNPECLNLTDELRAIPETEKLIQLIEDLKTKQALDALADVKKKMGME